jgi:hypothetical protein
MKQKKGDSGQWTAAQLASPPAQANRASPLATLPDHHKWDPPRGASSSTSVAGSTPRHRAHLRLLVDDKDSPGR